MNFQDIKKRFDALKATPTHVHPKIRGVIIGLLDKACGSKENRYQFAITLGMKPHSKDWTDGEWWAVSQMLKVDKPHDKWEATEGKFEIIVGAVMAQIGKQEGQTEMFAKQKRTAQEIIRELQG